MKRNKFLLIIILVLFIVPNSVYAQDGLLYNTLKENAIRDDISSTYVASESGIDFSEVSSDTNGKGLYVIGSTINDEYPIIYYRGNISNNYVIYAGFCWQIVRTTSTGGIKLLYSGTPNDNKCNNEKADLTIGKAQYNGVNSAPYYGWMYNTESGDVNVTDSLAKEYLDDWFENNMLDYVKELEDTVWCNDRTLENNVFDSRTRLEAGNPTLECRNKDDSFTVFSSVGNKKLTYPTGIINADELTYAGEVLKKTQTDTYVNINYSYWSMTPYVLNKNMYPNSKGMLNMYTFTYSAGIRPMISVRSSALISTGDGSNDNPYGVTVEKKYRVIVDDNFTTSNKEEAEYNEDVSLSNTERTGLKFVNYNFTDLDGNEIDIAVNGGKISMPSQDIKVTSNYRVLKDFYDLTTDSNDVEITETSVEEDQEASFKVNAPRGYKISSLKLFDELDNELDITISETDGNYKFTMPNKNVVIKVEFEELDKHVVDGDVENLSEDFYYADDKVEFKIIDKHGYEVSKIYVTDKDGNIIDVEIEENNGVYSFVMPDFDAKIKVEYRYIYNNPQTADLTDVYLLLFVISLGSLLGLIIKYKKCKLTE